MPLRDYQDRVLGELLQWFRENPKGNPIVDASVGAGKSIMIAALCKYAIDNWPSTRLVMAVSSQELAGQNFDTLKNYWPEAPATLASAGLGKPDISGQIVFGTVGTLKNRSHQLGRVDLLNVDECHNFGETGIYFDMTCNIRARNPGVRVIGWTGTPFRGNGVWLHKIKNGIFDDIAARISMRELLNRGYLSPLTPVQTQTVIDTDGIRKSGGDFVIRELDKVANTDELIAKACDELLRLATGRNRIMVYCVTVDHAKNVLRYLRGAGQRAEAVFHNTPRATRKHIINAFRRGEFRLFVNVATLTTGFDVPAIDCMALLRATDSPVLYNQIAGRGMRLSDGKNDCLWLDFTETTKTLGPVDAITGRDPAPPKTPSASQALDLYKACSNCFQMIPRGALVCSFCHHVAEAAESVNHDTVSSGAAVLSSQIRPERVLITRCDYVKHTRNKHDKATLRVNYWAGLNIVTSEFLAFEHAGYSKRMAAAWWSRRTELPIPATVDSALQSVSELRVPTAALLMKKGKYYDIKALEWD